MNYLSPSLSNGPWTQYEDKLLIDKVKIIGQRWSQIVAFFPTRSEVNIKNRYALLVSKGKAVSYKTSKQAMSRSKHKQEFEQYSESSPVVKPVEQKPQYENHASLNITTEKQCTEELSCFMPELDAMTSEFIDIFDL